MTLTTIEAPVERALHGFLIADWRDQPECHICGHGAAYYQCRVCGKGVHEECRKNAGTVAIHPEDGGYCVQAGCELEAFALVRLPNEMRLRYCEGHWYLYQATACSPPEGTCKCGYSVAAPGVGFLGERGWLCKRCGDLHTRRDEETDA